VVGFGNANDFHIRAEPPSRDVDVCAVAGGANVAVYDFVAVEFEPLRRRCRDMKIPDRWPAGRVYRAYEQAMTALYPLPTRSLRSLVEGGALAPIFR